MGSAGSVAIALGHPPLLATSYRRLVTRICSPNKRMKCEKESVISELGFLSPIAGRTWSAKFVAGTK